jgi:hypothetical protein
MPKYIFVYHVPKAYEAMADAEALPAWESCLTDVIGPTIATGWPVFEDATVVGEAGAATKLAGYSVVDTRDLESAVALAKACPALRSGGGVEVGALAELPGEHAAEVLRARRRSAQAGRRRIGPSPCYKGPAFTGRRLYGPRYRLGSDRGQATKVAVAPRFAQGDAVEGAALAKGSREARRDRDLRPWWFRGRRVTFASNRAKGGCCDGGRLSRNHDT